MVHLNTILPAFAQLLNKSPQMPQMNQTYEFHLSPYIRDGNQLQ